MNFDELDTGYFEPGSDADAIFAEASQKLHDMLKGEIKETINWYEQAKKEICGLEGKIASLRMQKAGIEQQVADALKKADEAEVNDIPARYINSLVKKYTGFYAPGDEVWVIRNAFHNEECPCCHGKKRIDVAFEGKSMNIECPCCAGCGTKAGRVSIVKKEIVSDVVLQLSFDKNRASLLSGYGVYVSGSDFATPLDSVYRTEDAATAKAEELNRKRENESKNSNS